MKDWKACERRIAELLGGLRVPVSGRQRGASPDVVHSLLSIEPKSHKSLPYWGALVVFHLEDFANHLKGGAWTP